MSVGPASTLQRRAPSTAPAQANVNLHIERLVLDGLPLSAAEGRIVQRALTQELTRLLAADGRIAGLGSLAVPGLLAPAIAWAAPAQPAALGRQLAQSLHVALRGAAA